MQTSVNRPAHELPLQPLDRLRLECEFQLIANNKERALSYYDQLLAASPSPYLLVARAKLLEVMELYPEAVENFEKALRISNTSADKMEILRLILDLESSSSVLKTLAEKAAGSVNADEPRTGIIAGQGAMDGAISNVAGEPAKDCRDDSPTILENRAADQANTILENRAADDSPTILEKSPMEKTAYVRPSRTAANETSPWPGLPEESQKAAGDEATSAKTFVIAAQAGGQVENKPAALPGKNDSMPPVSVVMQAGNYFDRYKILKQLGKGGMGVVYQALDTAMDRIVALKVIHAEQSDNQSYAQRFLQEVKATAKLRHPNIVAIYDFGEAPRHYFTMEYIDGKTLSSVIQEGIVKSRKAAEILNSIAQAIAAAHQEKIIHRDLKPSNIMLDKNGTAKVMDFGLAKFIENDTNLSRSGDIIGTPAYMSPEQAAGATVDVRSDIYAIGAVGYEMITGQQMFQGDSVLQILSQVANQDPVSPRSINGHVETEIETIILKCLEKSPVRRYQTAQELAEDLGRYLQHRPILAKPPTLVSKMAKWVRRNWGLAIAAATIVVSIVTAFAYMAYRWQQQAADNKALTMIHNMIRWNKHEVSFDTVEKEFAKVRRLSSNFIIYQMWAHFCYDYARICPEQRDHFYQMAMENFYRAIAINPDDYISNYFLYVTNKSLGNFDQAQRHLDRVWDVVNELDEENEFKYAGHGIKNMQLSRTHPEQREQLQTQACAYFNRAISYNQGLFCVYNLRAEIWLEQGKYEMAECDLKKSLELNPMHKDAVENMARLYLYWGSELLADGRHQAGKEYLHRSEIMFANYAELSQRFHTAVTAVIPYRRACLHLLSGDAVEAARLFQEARDRGIHHSQIEAERRQILLQCKIRPHRMAIWSNWMR